jgi:sugar/nucleoside kinase (ribokinase family)
MAKSVCYGAGLLALDVILNGSPESPAFLNAGGSCGNVLAILAYLGWETSPVARLAKDKASVELIKDLAFWNVRDEYIQQVPDGSTPIIIHRVLKDKHGNPKHKFEFKDPESGKWLPQYKPVLGSFVNTITFPKSTPHVYYFDRASRGTIDLARKSKENGALIFFEPTGINDLRLFTEAISVSDVLKFSSDRIGDFDKIFPSQQCLLEVRTLGSQGLEFRYSKTKKATKWDYLKPNAVKPEFILDAAGAGDWCSAGIIEQLGADGISSFLNLSKKDIINSLVIGQAYSSINICFIGARGAMYRLEKKTFQKTAEAIIKGKISILEETLSKKTPTTLKPIKNLKVSSLYSKKQSI